MSDSSETCICEKPPEGMFGWDRGMVDPDCPQHGHEAVDQETNPLLEGLKSIIDLRGDKFPQTIDTYTTAQEIARQSIYTHEQIQLVKHIACVCHEANRGYQLAWPTDGIPVALPWSEFKAQYPDQAEGVEEGVRLALNGATPEALHQSWYNQKINTGWVYGPIKDSNDKTHPCLLPYSELPEEQRIKDRLFYSIVSVFKSQ